MTEKNKPMSESELWDKFCIDSFFDGMDGTRNQFDNIVNLGRQGMIPADKAIEVPDVGEWPEEATGIRVQYVKEWKHADQPIGEEIAFIPRPTPSWTPKVGDAVFYENDDGIGIGKISHIDSDGFCAMNENNNVHWKSVKPFSPEKIGLPFDQI